MYGLHHLERAAWPTNFVFRGLIALYTAHTVHYAVFSITFLFPFP
jgi:hypothetical protein